MAPAVLTDGGGATLTINLNVAGEQLGVVSNGATYSFTLNGANTFANGGVASPGTDFSAFGLGAINLLAPGLARYSTINVTDSAAGAGVTFNDSVANLYSDAFTITLDNVSSGITFNGSSSFGANPLSASTDATTTLAAASAVSTAGAAVTLNANDMAINTATATLNAAGGTVTLGTATAARPIDLGTNTAGTLGLTDAELDRITAGTLIVGNATSGTLSVSNAINLTNGPVIGTLRLNTGANILDATGTEQTDLFVASLAMSAPTGVGGAGAADMDVQVTNLAASGGSGGVFVGNTGALTIATVSGITGVSATTGNIAVVAASPLTVNSDVLDTTGGNITLTSTNDGGNDDHLTINARVIASGGNGNITLNAGTDLIVNDSGATPDISVVGVGTITANVTRNTQLNANVTLQTAATGAVTINTDDIAINTASASISAAGAAVTIVPTTAGTAIDLGTNTAGSLSLTDAELDRISTLTLTIGNATSGAMSITTAINPGLVTGILTLRSGGSITRTAAANVITLPTLLIFVAGSIGAAGSPLQIDAGTLRADTSAANGNQFFSEANLVGLSGLNGMNAGAGTITFNGGTFTNGSNDRIADASFVNVDGGTFDIDGFTDTVAGVTLTTGSITGTVGTLTSNSTFQMQSGTASANLAGAVGLTKSTAALVTLSGTNTYTGQTSINAGTLRVAGGNAIPNTSAVVLANVAGAIFDLNGTTERIGSLAGGGAAGGNVTLGAGTLQTGGDNTTTSYDGVISGAGGGLVKEGAGIFTLTRAQPYTGTTAIDGGTLRVNAPATLAAGNAVSVNNTGTLGGTGTINGTVTVNNGGTLDPGVTTSIITVNNDVTFNPTATFRVQINGTTVSTQYDQLAVPGAGNTVALDGTLVIQTGFIPTINQTFTIIDNTTGGGISGAFANAPNSGDEVEDGIFVYRVDYTASTVILTFVAFVRQWDGGGGLNNNWTFNLNWVGDVTPNPGDRLRFGSGTFVPFNDFAANTNFARLIFNSATTFTISGAAVTLSDVNPGSAIHGITGNHNVNLNVTLTANRNTFDVAAPSNITINGLVVSAVGLVKVGAGRAILANNANAYTGITAVNVGTLTARVANALGSIANGTTVADAATLELDPLVNTTYAAEPLMLNGTLQNVSQNNIWVSGMTVGATGNRTIRVNTATSLTIQTGVVNLGTSLLIFDTVGVGTLLVTSQITGTSPALALVKIGTGTSTVSNNTNNYTGQTAVVQGTHVTTVNNGLGAIGAGANSSLVFGGATLRVDGSGLSIAEDLSLLAGTATLQNVTGNNDWTGIITLAGGTIDVVGATVLTVIGQITGTGGFTKIGTGTLRLVNNTNDYTGITSINAGTVYMNVNNGLGASGGGNQTSVAAGAELQLDSNITVPETLNALSGTLHNLSGTNFWLGGITVGGAGARTILTDAGSTLVVTSGDVVITATLLTVNSLGTTVISSNITSAVPGSGSLTKNGTGSLELAGNNSHTGTNTMNLGTLIIASDTAFGVSPATLVFNGGTILGNGVPHIIDILSFTVNNVSTPTVGGTSDLTWADPGTLNGTLTVTNIGTTTFLGNIAGNAIGGFTKTGVGLLIISGNNSYGGPNSLGGGITRITHGNALGSPAGATTVTGNSFLQVSGSISVPEPITFGNALTTGTLQIINGTNDWTGNITLANNTLFQILAGTQLLTSVATVNLATFTLTVEANGLTTIGNNISSTGAGNGITKTGSNTLLLDGTNTYTGPTAVTAGTVLVNGTTIGSTFGVANGATLGGSGTAGPTNVAAGGTLSPGPFPFPPSPTAVFGTGNTALASTSVFSVQLNGTTAGTGYDQLSVTGTVNLGGSTLTATAGFGFAIGDLLTIVNNDGVDPVVSTFAGLPNNGAAGFPVVIGGQAFRIFYNQFAGNDVVLRREGAVIQLSSSPNPSVLGQAVTFTAIVAGIAAGGTLTLETPPGTPIAGQTQAYGGPGTYIFTYAQLPLGASTLRVSHSGGTFSNNIVQQVDTFVVTGPDQGMSPLVRVFNSATGTLAYEFDAYSGDTTTYPIATYGPASPPGFIGGVRVAVGDVNADGFPDIITGAGPGGGPHVKVWNGLTNAAGTLPLNALLNFMAYDSQSTTTETMRQGIFVAAGNIDPTNPTTEIIVGPDQGVINDVRVFAVDAPPALGLRPALLRDWRPYAPGWFGGVRVAAGDLGGSAAADIITTPGPGGGPHVQVFDGATGSPVVAPTPLGAPLGSFMAFNPLFTGGVYVSVGNVNNIGRVDLILGPGAGGGPNVRVVDGNSAGSAVTFLEDFNAYSTTFTGGVRVGSVVKGGGASLIITGAGPSGGPHVRVFLGNDSNPATPPTVVTEFFAYTASFNGGVFVADPDPGTLGRSVDLDWAGTGLTAPSQATTLTPFTLGRSYRIAGSASAAEAAFAIDYYASVDAVFGNGDDFLLGTETVSAMSDRLLGSYTRNSPPVQFTRPGRYHLFAKLDAGNSISEPNEGNNAVQALQTIDVSGPAVIDSGDAGFATTGTWTVYAVQGYGFGSDIHYAAPGNGSEKATWSLGVTPGRYRVSVTYPAASNRATDAPFTVLDGNSVLSMVRVNQQMTPSDLSDGGALWKDLGVFTIFGNTLNVQLASTGSGYVIADAVRIELVAALPQGPDIEVFDGNTELNDGTSSVAFGSTQIGVPVTKTFTVRNSGSQTLVLSGTINVPAGFSVASGFGLTTLPTGASTTFAIRLDAGAGGSFGGAVSFNTNDTDEDPFDFNVGGAVSSVQFTDNGDPGFSTAGNWAFYSQAGYGYGSDIHYAAAGNGSDVATWAVAVTPGLYRVSATWPAHPNRATNAPYTLLDGTTALGTVRLNQQMTPNDFSDGGAMWEDLGTFAVSGNTLVVRLANDANGYVIADAVRVEQVGALPQGPEIQVLDGSTSISDGGTVAFGSTQGGVPVTKTFTVRNTGTQDLVLSGPITVPARFSLVSGFGATTLTPGSSTTFSVRLDAAATGTYSGTLSFGTNDADENPFDFTVTGSVSNVQIIDNGGAGFAATGGWAAYSQAGYGYGSNLLYAAAGNGSAEASWTFAVAPGQYRISVTWPAESNRATNAPYALFDGGASLGTVRVNQQQPPMDLSAGGMMWKDLGTVTLTGTTLVVKLSNSANGYVIADAVRVEQVGALPQGPEIEVVDGTTPISDGGTVAFGNTQGGVPVTKTFMVRNTGTQDLVLSGSITLPAGFSLASGFGTTTLTPGSATTFSVRLDAAATGSYSGTLSFGTNDADENPFDFTLTGSVSNVQIIDNGGAGFAATAGWTAYSQAGYGYASNLLFAAAGNGSAEASWTFAVAPGRYRISVTWPAETNRATNAPYTLIDGGTSLGTVQVNQQQPPMDLSAGAMMWKDLGTFTLTGSTLVVKLANNANGYVIADAVRIEWLGP